jgi:hypothetical protein
MEFYSQWKLFVEIGYWIREPLVDITNIASDHILLSYISTKYLGDKFSKSLVEYDANGFCQIGIRFEISKYYTLGENYD